MLFLLWEIILLNVFNVIDAVFTLNAMRYGAEEMNPVMAALLECGPFAFLTVKIFAYLLATIFIYQYCNDYPRFIKYSVGFLFVAYGILTVYHFVIFGIITFL